MRCAIAEFGMRKSQVGAAIWVVRGAAENEGRVGSLVEFVEQCKRVIRFACRVAWLYKSDPDRSIRRIGTEQY